MGHPSKVTIITPKKKNSSLSSRLQLVSSKKNATNLRSKMTFLRSTLPAGSLNIFNFKRAGSGFGMSNTCPFCDEKPPFGIKPWNRRRWQAAHLAVVHVKQIREPR